MREDWEIIELGEICEVVTKGTTPTSIGYKYQDNGINFIKIESIDLNGSFIPEKFAHIDEEANEALKRSQLKSGDILFSIAGALGRTAIVTDDVLPANTNQALSIIRLKDDAPVTKEYLFSALSTGLSLEQIEKFKGGVAQQNLSLTQIKNFKIPIPPLPEQKRIVEILDEAFEAIDQARANVERNIQNAEELFQSKLNEIFSQRGEGWEEFKVKDLGEVITGTTPPTKDESNYGDFIPFIKPGHFQTNGSLDHEDSMLSEKGLENGRLIDEKSVLMVCIGASIGKTGYTDIPVSSNQQINAVTPTEDFNAKLIYYGMISRYFFNQVLLNASQTTLPIINKTKWSKLRLNIPTDRKIQNDIVSNLDEIRTETLSIIDSYSQKLDAIEELNKSILQKAFSGELTANEHVAV